VPGSNPGISQVLHRFPIREAAWVAAAISIAVAMGLAGPRSSIALLTAAIAFAVTLIIPSAGLALLVASVPIQDCWPASVVVLTLPWTRLILFCFLAAWVARVATGRDTIRTTSIIWAMSAYVVALIASTVNVVNVGLAAAEIYRWGVATVVLVAATSILRSQRDYAGLLLGLAAGVLFSFAVAVIQVWTDSGPRTFSQLGILRAYGLFGEPNAFAGYLEIATLPLLAFCVVKGVHAKPRNQLVTMLALLGSIFGVTSLMLTQSRGGALGFATGVAIIMWCWTARGGRALIVALSLLAVVVLLTPPAGSIRSALGFDALLGRGNDQVTTENFSTQERLAHWGAALRMWQEHSIVGIGAGNFNERFREFTPGWRFRIPRGHAHNGYLQAASQAGIVGLICYLAVLGTAWQRCRRGLARACSADQRAICCGALAVTGAVAVHGMFEYLHVLSLGIVLSAIWASVEIVLLANCDALAADGDN
jgi:O-antigen ligase